MQRRPLRHASVRNSSNTRMGLPPLPNDGLLSGGREIPVHVLERIDRLAFEMMLVRHIMAAFLAAAVAWGSAMGGAPAHAHPLSGHHGTPQFAVFEADAHHHAVIDDHHHDEQQPSDGDQNVPPEHENAVFHVHGPSLVAVTPDPIVFNLRVAASSASPPYRLVSLHSRSDMPPDRPPRLIL